VRNVNVRVSAQPHHVVRVDALVPLEARRQRKQNVKLSELITILTEHFISHEMATNVKDDELAVDETEGFKVGEQKTIDEYTQLGIYPENGHLRRLSID